MSDVTPWTVARQAPLSMGFPMKEYWSELPFLSLGGLPDPGIKPALPAWQVDSLPLSHQGSPISPGQPLIYFLTLWICLSGHFIQMESCICSPLWLAYFTEHSSVKAHPCMYYYIAKHFIVCRPLLLLPSIFPSSMVFFSVSAHWIRWPKY